MVRVVFSVSPAGRTQMVQWCHLPTLHSIAQLLRWAGRFKRKDTLFLLKVTV